MPCFLGGHLHARTSKVLSGVYSLHLRSVRAGRKPSSTVSVCGPQAWGHLVLLKVTGQQLKGWQAELGLWPPAPCSSPGIGLQRVQPVWKTTAAPLCLCVVENWPLHLQKPGQAKAWGAGTLLSSEASRCWTVWPALARLSGGQAWPQCPVC